MTSKAAIAAQKLVIDAALSIAEEVGAGTLAPHELEAVAVQECLDRFGTVVGPGDPLWEVHGSVCRQYLAAGGMPAHEFAEWSAVIRAAEGVEPEPARSWIETALEQMNDEGDDDGDGDD